VFCAPPPAESTAKENETADNAKARHSKPTRRDIKHRIAQ
jgi:hypothetical protein